MYDYVGCAWVKGSVGLCTSLKMSPAGRREPFPESHKGIILVSSEALRIYTPYTNPSFGFCFF